MDELLTVSSTRRLKSGDPQPASAQQQAPATTRNANKLSSSDDVLEILRSGPSLAELTKSLQWLRQRTLRPGDFNVKLPGPKASRLVFLLANEILAHFWPVLRDDPDVDGSKPRIGLITCLSSIAGLGALASRLRILTRSLEHGTHGGSSIHKRPAESFHLSETLDFLQTVLEQDGFIAGLLHDVEHGISKPVQRDVAWKELVAWLGTGKLVHAASEASSVNSWATLDENDGLWISNGSKYATWLGQNILASVIKLETSEAEEWKKLVLLYSKSLSLGYTGKSRSTHTPTLADDRKISSSRQASPVPCMVKSGKSHVDGTCFRPYQAPANDL